jgi:hypothetical protein
VLEAPKVPECPNVLANLLQQILIRDFAKTRTVLQHMIRELRLVPVRTEKGAAFDVMGEIDLFTPFSGEDKRVLLERSSTRTLQQYTAHVDFLFRFAGEMVYTNYDAALPPSPIVESLQKLLRTEPDLLNQVGGSEFWSEHLRRFGGLDGSSDPPFTTKRVAQHFSKYGNSLRENFGMKRVVVKQRFVYSFSSVGEFPASVSSDASLVPATEGGNADHDEIAAHASDGDESEPDVSSD